MFNEHDFFNSVVGNSSSENSILKVFEAGDRNSAKQATHSLDAARLIEIDLKGCLLALTKELFGQSNKELIGQSTK